MCHQGDAGHQKRPTSAAQVLQKQAVDGRDARMTERPALWHPKEVPRDALSNGSATRIVRGPPQTGAAKLSPLKCRCLVPAVVTVQGCLHEAQVVSRGALVPFAAVVLLPLVFLRTGSAARVDRQYLPPVQEIDRHGPVLDFSDLPSHSNPLSLLKLRRWQ